MILKKAVKAFTLVELIVAMALMSIIMVMIAMIIKPVDTVYNDVKQYTGDRTVINEIGEYVADSIKYSTEVYIFNGCKPDTNLIPAADQSDYSLIKLCNNEFDTWTSIKYYGRMYMQREYDSSSGMPASPALGKAFYGRQHYSFAFKWGQKYDASATPPGYVEDKTIPVFVVTSYHKDSDGTKGDAYLSAESASDMLNVTPVYCDYTVTPVINPANPKDATLGNCADGPESDVIYILYKKNT